MTMCHTVPRPVPFACQCAIRYHDQCNMTMRHTVTQPVYFTWQYVIRYHDQCLSPGNVLYGTTTSVFHMAQRLKVRLQVLTRCSFSVTWESSVGIPLAGSTTPHVRACPKPRHGFPTIYVAVFIRIQ
jgi:hypothetical protein